MRQRALLPEARQRTPEKQREHHVDEGSSLQVIQI
jgi:hypothetical protein